jgi:plastocyanin
VGHKTVHASLPAAMLACLIPCAATFSAASAERKQVAHTVIIEDMQFSPAKLTVRLGERIVWVNRDLFPHTVTSTTEAFDSGSIAANGSWSFTPRKAGEYPYTCTFHPTMTATITVR